MAAFSHLLEALGEIPDPRRAQGKRYPLSCLLLFTVLALLSGATSYEGIVTFLHERRDDLNRHFGMELRRAPAVNTVRTLLQRLDPTHLEAALRQHAQALMQARTARTSREARPFVALDGKVLRGSFDRMQDQKAAQVLSAFACEHALVLAQTDIDDKSNEIPAAERLIRDLKLQGVIFTADAIHCQKNTSLPQRIPATT